MVPQQPATARAEEDRSAPPAIAAAASRYQTFREIEAEHLALMARHNLFGEWTADVRSTVIEARARVCEAREARADFRRQVRDFVIALRGRSESLPAVLRQTRVMLRLLERAGSIRGDGGWLEAEVLEWAIEEYEC